MAIIYTFKLESAKVTVLKNELVRFLWLWKTGKTVRRCRSYQLSLVCSF